MCATYFCKHGRGATGKTFWLALQALLAAVEKALARHAVLALDPGSEALEALFPPRRPTIQRLSAENLDGIVDPALARRCWGTWMDRQREFFLEAARIIGRLRWKEILAIGGSEVTLRAKLVGVAFQRLGSARIPDQLRPGSFEMTPLSAERARVTGYSGNDPLEVPRKLLDVLHRFDGRSTSAAVRAIASDHGLRLTPGLIRKLVDFGILVEADPTAQT
jgi:hypothetical protein